jgi:hypothetical protein
MIDSARVVLGYFGKGLWTEFEADRAVNCVRDEHMCARCHSYALELGDGVVSGCRVEDKSQAEVNRNASGIHPESPDGVEADADASRVHADLPNKAGFGDHLDRRLWRLLDADDDQVGLLRFHPLKVRSAQFSQRINAASHPNFARESYGRQFSMPDSCIRR